MPKPRDKVTDDMGPPIKTFEGLRVHARLYKPKTTRGRPRIWMVIKQSKGAKRWRVAETLSYVNAVHIQFEPISEEPER